MPAVKIYYDADANVSCIKDKKNRISRVSYVPFTPGTAPDRILALEIKALRKHKIFAIRAFRTRI